MNRNTGLAVAVAAALVGCPLPQPLPEYSPGAVTPPRIVVDDSVTHISSPGTIVPVPAGCSGIAPSFPLVAQIRDSNTVETIEVRWFVNYNPFSTNFNYWRSQQTVAAVTPAPPDPTFRTINAYTFEPYQFPPIAGTANAPDAVGALHIVELVVSNGFWTGSGEPLPNRSPAPGFEVQVYRWVFLNVAPPVSPATCAADDPLCAVCPT